MGLNIFHSLLSALWRKSQRMIFGPPPAPRIEPTFGPEPPASPFGEPINCPRPPASEPQPRGKVLQFPSRKAKGKA
jgi:hypothetical protein